MAPASAYTADRSARYRRPARTVRRAGLRWDRVGRLALLVVLVVLVYLYVSAGVSLLATWHASKQDAARVVSLKHENATLKSERAALKRGYETETAARKLGLGRAGEKYFVVRGLPKD